jgi:hypothetical protein
MNIIKTEATIFIDFSGHNIVKTISKLIPHLMNQKIDSFNVIWFLPSHCQYGNSVNTIYVLQPKTFITNDKTFSILSTLVKQMVEIYKVAPDDHNHNRNRNHSDEIRKFPIEWIKACKEDTLLIIVGEGDAYLKGPIPNGIIMSLGESAYKLLTDYPKFRINMFSTESVTLIEKYPLINLHFGDKHFNTSQEMEFMEFIRGEVTKIKDISIWELIFKIIPIVGNVILKSSKGAIWMKLHISLYSEILSEFNPATSTDDTCSGDIIHVFVKNVWNFIHDKNKKIKCSLTVDRKARPYIATESLKTNVLLAMGIQGESVFTIPTFLWGKLNIYEVPSIDCNGITSSGYTDGNNETRPIIGKCKSSPVYDEAVHQYIQSQMGAILGANGNSKFLFLIQMVIVVFSNVPPKLKDVYKEIGYTILRSNYPHRNKIDLLRRGKKYASFKDKTFLDSIRECCQNVYDIKIDPGIIWYAICKILDPEEDGLLAVNQICHCPGITVENWQQQLSDLPRVNFTKFYSTNTFKFVCPISNVDTSKGGYNLPNHSSGYRICKHRGVIASNIYKRVKEDGIDCPFCHSHIEGRDIEFVIREPSNNYFQDKRFTVPDPCKNFRKLVIISPLN